MIIQPIVDLVSLLAEKGIKNAIISPGSRNAPLTIALVRHASINTKSISDERSAGFIALGMSQTINEPVILCCTSGSAVYNYAPAVAEAFFQEVPLVILSADRPKEWIHQNDGQTIYQQEIFGKHIKKSFSLGADYQNKDAKWETNRLINEAINIANTIPKGPVHINIPLREPFYPENNEQIVFNKVRNIEQINSFKTIQLDSFKKLSDIILSGKKVLLAIGQHHLDNKLIDSLKEFSKNYNIPIVGEIFSNLGNDFIHNQDLFSSKLAEEYVPDVLITSGRSFISKSFKTFLRKNTPTFHLHFQESQLHIDTFQSITHLIESDFKDFISKMNHHVDTSIQDEERLIFRNKWQEIDLQNEEKKKLFFNIPSDFNEITVVNTILNNIPSHSILHLANSMSVRYANYIGLSTDSKVEVFANRGTSGIDGCLSTAIGCAMSTDKLVFLIIGDLAFFYDRNALWNNYLPNNIRIILLNNHGGSIFRMIEGPNQQPELNEYFETIQTMNAKNTAEDAGFKYIKIQSNDQLNIILPEVIQEEFGPSITEIDSNAVINTAIFKQFKQI